MTHIIRCKSSRTATGLIAASIFYAFMPLISLAQQTVPSPFINPSTKTDRIPSSLHETLEKVSLEHFDIRILRNPKFFRLTGFNAKRRQQFEGAIAEAASTAKSRFGEPPTRPRVMTTQGTQFYMEMLNSHYDDIKSETDRQINKVATPRFLQSISKSELARLRQVWLQFIGPSSDVLSDLNVSEAQQQNIETQMKSVREAIGKATGDEAIFRVAQSGVRDVLKESLTSSQWSLWIQLTGQEVAAD